MRSGLNGSMRPTRIRCLQYYINLKSLDGGMCFDGNQAIRIRRTYSGIGTDRTADYQSNGSDTAKFLEAACYALSKHEDSKLRALVDEQIGWIRTSQWDDGYINSYFTLVEPQNRFTNLRFSSGSTLMIGMHTSCIVQAIYLKLRLHIINSLKKLTF